MTAPAFESVATAVRDTTGSTFACDKPSGTVEGNLMIATVVTRRQTDNVHSAPSGWTEINQTAMNSIGVKSTWRKVAGASEPSDYTFSSSSAAPRWAIAIARYSGVDTTDPIDVTATSSGIDTDTPIAPSVTTTVADTLIIRSAGSYDTGLANPSGHTARWQTTGSFAKTSGATVAQASAGASGTADFTLSASRDWVATTIALAPAAAGGPTYTLTCDVGSFALTGIDAGLQAGRRITADVGSFALTGIDAGLTANRLITAGVGSFALTGIDADLTYSGAVGPTYTLTCDVGSFALTGIDAGLQAGRLLTADVGSFALTGIDAGLTYSGPATTYTLTCDVGSFALTGIDAGLLAGRRITADVGTFALAGIDTGLLANRRITADAASFTLTGIDAAFVTNRRLAADTGAFTLTGIDANLSYSGAPSSLPAYLYYYLMSGA